MMDPARTAAMDQQLAGMRDVAVSCGAFYKLLTTADIPDHVAGELVKVWFESQLSAALMKATGEIPDD